MVRSFQPFTQRQDFFQFGNNSFLLSKGWERKKNRINFLSRHDWLCSCITVLSQVHITKHMNQISSINAVFWIYRYKCVISNPGSWRRYMNTSAIKANTSDYNSFLFNQSLIVISSYAVPTENRNISLPHLFRS